MGKFDLLLRQEPTAPNLLDIVREAARLSAHSNFYMVIANDYRFAKAYGTEPGDKYGISHVGRDLDKSRGQSMILWSDPGSRYGDYYDTSGIISKLGELITLDRFIPIVRRDGMVPVALRVDKVSIEGVNLRIDASAGERWKGVGDYVEEYTEK